MSRRVKKIADTVVMILKKEGAKVDLDLHTGIPRGCDMGSLSGRMTAAVCHRVPKNGRLTDKLIGLRGVLQDACSWVWGW